jgi:ankyrin repeat protein
MNETLDSLASAARAGKLDTVSKLLDEDPTLLQSHDERRRQTLLMIAAATGHTALVSLLLDLGADVNPCDHWGFTCLHFAAQGGYSEIVCALLRHGAGAAVRDDDSYTPLMYVATKCNMEAMQQALKTLGTEDINTQTVEGYTALYMACKCGRAEQAVALLWAGADHTLPDKYGVTPRDVARRRSHRNCVARIDVSKACPAVCTW